jgi:hypothetical protein
MSTNSQPNNLFKVISNKSKADGFEEKKKMLRAYFTTVVEALNKEANLMDAGISFEIPEDNDISTIAGKIPNADRFNSTYEKIFPEQIASAFDAMQSIIVEDLAHEHVTGLTQLGKNGMITVLMDFLGVVSYSKMKKQKILLPVAWLPNAINMEKQSIEKLTQSSLLNGIIIVKYEDDSFKLGEFNEVIKSGMCKLIAENINKKASNQEITVTEKTKLLQNNSELFGPEGNRSALVLRRSAVNDQKYKWLFQAASESPSISGYCEVNITLIMDESHIAIGKGQGVDRVLGLDTEAYPTELKVNDQIENEDQQDTEAYQAELEVDDQIEDEDQQISEDEVENNQESKEIMTIATTYAQIFTNKAKLLTVSATNTPWNCINYQKDKKPVYLKVANGYCGFAFVDGYDYPLEEGVEVVEPIVKPMSEMAKLIPSLKHLNLRHLGSAFSYARSIELEDWLTVRDILNNSMPVLAANFTIENRKILKTVSDNGYGRNLSAKIMKVILGSRKTILIELANEIKEQCSLYKLLEEAEFKKLFTGTSEKLRKEHVKRLCSTERSLEAAWKKSFEEAQNSLAALLEYLLLNENPQNKKGCILRWECKNDVFNNFIKPLESQLGGRIKFIPYMGESANQTVAELLENVNPDNMPYVVVVTGRGRYGESYPSGCGYAIDGTTKNASSAAFFQSLLGRISGYNKYNISSPENSRPMLILSDLAYDQVFMPLKNGKGYSPKVGNGMNLKKTGRDFKPVEHVCIKRDPFNSSLEVMFGELDQQLTPHRGLALNALEKSIKLNLFTLIMPIVDYIENNPIVVTKNMLDVPSDQGLTFLRPGQKIESPDNRMLDWHGRKPSEIEPPINAHSFVAFEPYLNGRKKFGLTSNRNNNFGAEYLYTGIQLEKATYKAMAIWLWLQKPIVSTVTGPSNGACVPAPGSVPENVANNKRK